ncbi:MAG TPA: class I SAM-dependent methyltransferase [Gemmataceae bacterium]|jgi:SAM-dependent methyltransferase|nr:class I SAM-dependent methyltransferase [Gemmataceae bacterium]
MSNTEGLNPTGRFTGLAHCYARYRPSYPPQAIDCLLCECGLAACSTVVDIGCGTGISSRLLAERGLRVIGIDPNADMLTTAKQTQLGDVSGSIDYRQGKAEETGLDSGIARAVTAFQAFHWFSNEATLEEFHRILEPRGWLALIWNDRDDRDPLTSAYHKILSNSAEGRAITNSWRTSTDILRKTPWFQPPSTFTFPSEQILNEEGLIGRAMSASYAPREPVALEKMKQELRDLFASSQVDRNVRMHYQVHLFLAKRSDHG